MTLVVHLAKHDVLSGAIEDHRADTPDAIAALKGANAALDAGQAAQAGALAETALRDLVLGPMSAASFILILHAAGKGEQAGSWTDALLAQLEPMATDAARKINLGRMMLALRRPDGAEMLISGLSDLPRHKAGILALTAHYLRQRDVAQATALWQPLFTADATNGLLRLDLVRILAQAGFADDARRMLDQAEPLCTNHRGEFNHVAAALRGTDAGAAQAAMTIEVFDRFAPTYDATLAKLGNRGPDTIARLLTAVGLPAKRQLAVLDAGCGTGLCGRILRPYAKRLVGVDLSPGMLAKARARKVFHHLDRCDLGSIGTYPRGPFDLLISADVLVYFGDLAPVFANFAAVLRPGGWLMFTVEGIDQGWHLAPTGRHKHSLSYLEDTLRKAGFARPAQVDRSDLRHEFGAPVPGIGVAVQRLALFG